MHDSAGQTERVIERLRARGFIRGDRSVWGCPIASIPAGHEPQLLDDANVRQRDIVTLSYAIAWPGADRCASWVRLVVSAAGLGAYPGDASFLYHRYCHEADPAALKVGMIVCVDLQPWFSGSAPEGHVGLYVGDGMVRDSTSTGVREVALEPWLVAYGLEAEPRWGWMGGVALA